MAPAARRIAPPSRRPRRSPRALDRPLPRIEALRFERFETRLRDGTPVLVRPIEREDRDRLAAGFRRLSAESRYRRFMAPIAELSDEQLRYLTEVDHVDHFAWVAVRADDPEDGMGVARYVRLDAEPHVAEAAVTVVDEHQGTGLGTLMLALLAVAARAAGIDTFRAYVLEENRPMRELLESLGARAEHDSPGALRLDVPLDPGAIPDSPAGRVLKAVAASVITAIPGPSARRG